MKDEIYETMLDEADNPIELFHGYTYSGHPIAAAAGLATAFGLLIKSNIAAIDKLQKTAEKLGVNVEFLQKMRFFFFVASLG